MDYRILGPLEVYADGELIPIGGPRQRALLALLLLNANRVVSRSQLIDALWEDGADDHALRVCVSRLRKALGTDTLETRPPGYVLHVARGELDLDRFRELVEHGQWREAEGLWRGRPLADLEHERFARTEIEPLAALLPSVIEERVAVELAAGRHAALVPELEALVEAYPLRERMRAHLMLALYRSGRQADALAAYRVGRERLVEELGLDPGPDLVQLELAILRHDPALSLPVARPLVRRRPRLAPWTVAALVSVVVIVLAIALGDSGPRAAPSPVRGNAAMRIGGSPVALPAAPSRAVAGFGSLWITHVDAGTVTRVDLATQTVRQTVHVGAGPLGVAIADGAVWVASSLAGTVSRIDPETNTVVQTVPVGSGPSALAAAGATLWVTVQGDGGVARVDTRTARVVDRVRTGSGPGALAVHGGTLWVANAGDGTVARVEAGAVVGRIRAGDAPTALAATANGVWVADRLDATLSYIDAERGVVTSTLAVGGAPADVAVQGKRVWATVAGTLAELDGRRVVRRTPVGERAGPLAVIGGALWVGVGAGGAQHRGGTLTVAIADGGPPFLDPALGGPPLVFALSHDGLVGFEHAEGSRIVPDLATSLPLPSDEGRTYVFRLRSGVRFSDGTVVRPSDVRRSFERMYALDSAGTDIYAALREVVADDRQGTVTFHLAERDPEFLYKLALPYANVVGRKLVGTGPYVVRVTANAVVYDRNPHFREWSSAAQPDGYPDHIVWPRRLTTEQAATLVETGGADLLLNIGPAAPGHRELLRTRFASGLHINPLLGTEFWALNVRSRPFDDVRVRRALNFAIDRDRVAKIFGGATPTCQFLPAQMPGYRHYCPYRRDLARARRLVAASGTRGMTVTVWATTEPAVGLAEARHVVATLRRIGYRARMQRRKDPSFPADAQVMTGGWTADYPTAGAFIGRLRCGDTHWNAARFCDPAFDRRIARAQRLQETAPRQAQRLWQRLDRELTDRAVLVPTVAFDDTAVTARHVGNYHFNPFLSVLVDQLWVR